MSISVSYTHLRAHETRHDLVCRLLLEKKKKQNLSLIPICLLLYNIDILIELIRVPSEEYTSVSAAPYV